MNSFHSLSRQRQSSCHITVSSDGLSVRDPMSSPPWHQRRALTSGAPLLRWNQTPEPHYQAPAPAAQEGWSRGYDSNTRVTNWMCVQLSGIGPCSCFPNFVRSSSWRQLIVKRHWVVSRSVSGLVALLPACLQPIPWLNHLSFVPFAALNFVSLILTETSLSLLRMLLLPVLANVLRLCLRLYYQYGDHRRVMP